MSGVQQKKAPFYICTVKFKCARKNGGIVVHSEEEAGYTRRGVPE